MMLCQSIKERELKSYDNPNWITELKLDGTRCMLIKSDNKINLLSRDNNDYTAKYPQIVKEAEQLPDCVLDGELTFYDINGKDVFLTSLATEKTIKDYNVKPKLMVFDILELKGIDLKREPLLKRKTILKDNITNSGNIELLPYSESPIELWEFVKKTDREGIILKNKQSPYTMGYRSKLWLKVKYFKESIMYFDGYDVMPNNKGITLTNKGKYRVACLGSQSIEVRDIIGKKGGVNVRIQYQQKTKDNRYRFISFRGLE